MAKQTNEVISARPIITGSYSGDDADDRQITTGMKCTRVCITQDGNAGNWVMIPGDARSGWTGALLAGGSELHATDGFTVYQTTDAINAVGQTYRYWAIGEE